MEEKKRKKLDEYFDDLDKEKKIAMISGHLNTTLAEFHKFYSGEIEKCAKEGYKFIVGGAKGTDTLAQLHLMRVLNDLSAVTVYDRGDEDNRQHKSFQHKNGYASYTQRDENMTAESSMDIAFLHKDGGGSGTAANIIRRKLGPETAREVQAIFRNNTMYYDDWAKSAFMQG